MDNQITPDIAEAILSFLARAQIAGSEAPTFMNVVALLNRLAAPPLSETTDGTDEHN